MTTEKPNLTKSEQASYSSSSPGQIYLILGAAIIYGVVVALLIAFSSGQI